MASLITDAILLGAPLNTPPAAGGTAPVMNTNPVQPVMPATPPVTTPAAPATQATAPGFSGKPNPEHGMPGHRCDLAVGAILP